MRTQLFIGGQWQAAARTFAVDNPATLETVAEVADGERAHARAAVDAAAAALPEWAARPAPQRAQILHRVAAAMLDAADQLAWLMTSEGGKPLAEAKGEVAYAASFFSWFAGETERVYGRLVPASTPGKRLAVLRQPVGVVGAITPWNFPAAMITRKVAPALAAGCTVVLKPAEQTPLTALALAELMAAAGVPAGVVNVVPTNDAAAVGAELLENPRVRKITFTGSTEVGKYLAREAAAQVKRVSLELGGNAPFIVFADADLAAAAQGALASKFRNAGQTCICANRFYVHEKVRDEFLGRFTELVRGLKVGDGREKGVQVGPLIDDAGMAKVTAHVAEAVAQGARVETGGHRVESAGSPRFYQPTVLTGVADGMRIMREETFGPVAPVATFADEEEVLARANAGNYGLAAYYYTRDQSRAWRVAEALGYGVIGANDGTPSTAQAPFGGFKESGIGREGGAEGIDAFLESKYVSFGL